MVAGPAVHDDAGLGTSPLRSARVLAARLALVGGSALFSAGVAELALRLGARPGNSPAEYVAFRKSSADGLDYEFVPEARLPWVGREIRINRQGFRGPDFSLEPTMRPRIAIIGDSIAAGYGVAEEESFPYRLASLMREGGHAGEVLGFGVPGYNLDHIVAVWSAKVVDYRPDLVLYAMCLNDAMPELRLTPQGVLEPAGTIEISPERSRPGRVPLPGKDWLREHSLLYEFLMTRYDMLLRRLGLRGQPLPPSEAIERVYVGSRTGSLFLARLDELIDSVRQTGAGFVLICFPMGEQLQTQRAVPQAALRRFAASRDLPFVDLYGPFLDASRTGRRALDADGIHPTVNGHLVAAQETLEALQGTLRSHGDSVPAPRIRPASARRQVPPPENAPLQTPDPEGVP
jgi:lysophospholipase L1-like esterase